MLRRVIVALGLLVALAPLCGAPARAVTPSPMPAPTCLIPFVFSPFTVANANQVNSNFSALATCVNSVLVGAGFPSLQCSGLASCSPNSGATPSIYVPTPAPTASSTGCGALSITGSYPNYVFNGSFTSCSSAGPQATPSPTVTATACAGAPTVSGTWPYTITIPAGCSGGGGSGITLQTSPSPSPQGGYAALTGIQLWDGAGSGWTGLYIGPNPVPSATYAPDAIEVSEGTAGGACLNGFRAGWGTTGITLGGIAGTLFSVTCANAAIQPYFNIDAHGNASLYDTFYPDIFENGTAMVVQGGDALLWLDASSDSANCVLKNGFGLPGGLILQNSGGGTCTFSLPDLSPSTGVCTSTSATHTLLGNCPQGQIVCAVSSATNCSATASPIPTGLACRAAYDAAATTVSPAPNDLSPLMVKVSGPTLTVYMGTTTALTGNLAADWSCP